MTGSRERRDTSTKRNLSVNGPDSAGLFYRRTPVSSVTGNNDSDVSMFPFSENSPVMAAGPSDRPPAACSCSAVSVVTSQQM